MGYWLPCFHGLHEHNHQRAEPTMRHRRKQTFHGRGWRRSDAYPSLRDRLGRRGVAERPSKIFMCIAASPSRIVGGVGMRGVAKQFHVSVETVRRCLFEGRSSILIRRRRSRCPVWHLLILGRTMQPTRVVCRDDIPGKARPCPRPSLIAALLLRRRSYARSRITATFCWGRAPANSRKLRDRRIPYLGKEALP